MRFPHLFDQVEREAHAVFQAAAVLIFALVPKLAHELVDQVATVTLDHDGVTAGGLRPHRRVAEALFQVLDLVDGERDAQLVGEVGAGYRAGGVGWLAPFGESHATDAGADHQ